MTGPLAPCRPVAAVITDGPQAVPVARRAARLAVEQNRPLLLLVPMRRAAFTIDAIITARKHQEALHEAQAIVARTRPSLEAAGVCPRAQVVWCRTSPSHHAHQTPAIAIAHAAQQAGAAMIVTPAQLPVPTVKYGAEVLLLASHAQTEITVHRPARSRRLDQL